MNYDYWQAKIDELVPLLNTNTNDQLEPTRRVYFFCSFFLSKIELNLKPNHDTFTDLNEFPLIFSQNYFSDNQAVFFSENFNKNYFLTTHFRNNFHDIFEMQTNYTVTHNSYYENFLMQSLINLDQSVSELSTQHNDEYENELNNSFTIPATFNHISNNSNNIAYNYLFLRQKTFIWFFLNNLIDVPICFKKSPSLKFKVAELPRLKFINFLMEKGKKEKMTKLVIKAFIRFYQIVKVKLNHEFELSSSWLFFFRMFYVLNFYQINDKDGMLNFDSTRSKLPSAALDLHEYMQNEFGFFSTLQNTTSTFGLILNDENSFDINWDLFLKNFFLNHVSKVLPIFTFYIYNVDKNVRKFSRGKSGKYIFIWKYVPFYKRLKVILKLITKQVKFNQQRTFFFRLLANFLQIHNNKSNFITKRKNFTYNYVFKNFKYSLMKNYLTLTV